MRWSLWSRSHIVGSIRRANQDIPPKLESANSDTQESCSVFAAHEPRAHHGQEMRTSTRRENRRLHWTGQDSEDPQCFSCVVVWFGDHVIDLVCAKQDVVAVNASESEFYAMTTGGAHDIHTKNIFGDLQVELIVRLETNSTSAPGICRRRGVGRLRHLH